MNSDGCARAYEDWGMGEWCEELARGMRFTRVPCSAPCALLPPFADRTSADCTHSGSLSSISAEQAETQCAESTRTHCMVSVAKVRRLGGGNAMHQWREG